MENNMQKEINMIATELVDTIKTIPDFVSNCSSQEFIEEITTGILKKLDKKLEDSFIEARQNSLGLIFIDQVLNDYENETYTARFHSAKNADEMKAVYEDLWKEANSKGIQITRFLTGLYYNYSFCKGKGFDPEKWFKTEKVYPVVIQEIKSAANEINNKTTSASSAVKVNHNLGNNGFSVNNFVAPAQTPDNISAGKILSKMYKPEPVKCVFDGGYIANNNNSMPGASFETKVCELKKHFNFIPGKHKDVKENEINGLINILYDQNVKNAIIRQGVNDDIATLMFNEVEVSKYPTPSDNAFNIAFECKTSNGNLLIKYNTNSICDGKYLYHNFYVSIL